MVYYSVDYSEWLQFNRLLRMALLTIFIKSYDL